MVCEEGIKVAALAVRDTQVLEICCAAGTLSDVGFESALEKAFRRQLGRSSVTSHVCATSQSCWVSTTASYMN